MSRWLIIPLVIVLLAADWARFRGPNGTGTSTDKDVPVTWTKDNILWKVPVEGTGHSSPIVVGKKLFVQTATRTNRQVLCFDAITGKRLWAKTVPGKVGKTHNKSSLASATPCSDGERVYCVFWDGAKVALYVYDFEGKLAWSRDLGSFKSQHGPGFSPIVHDGLVFVNNDQDSPNVSRLQVFHAKTGKPAWDAERTTFRACYSTPIVHGEGKETQLLVASTAGVTAYEPRTGKVAWNYTWSFDGMALRTVGSPVISGDQVVLCSGDGSGARSMIAVKLGGKGDVTKTHKTWRKDDAGTPYVPTLIAHGGYLYGVTDKSGNAVCWEARSGKELWRTRLQDKHVSSSPVLIDGKIYVIDEGGTVYVLATNPKKLERLATYKLGEGVLSSPAVANGRLYIRTKGHLVCVGKPAK